MQGEPAREERVGGGGWCGRLGQGGDPGIPRLHALRAGLKRGIGRPLTRRGPVRLLAPQAPPRMKWNPT
jgi:hypothetical protein